MITRRCDICYIDFHRASLAKHVKNKKHLEKMRIMQQEDLLIPNRLFQKSNQNLNNIPRRK